MSKGKPGPKKGYKQTSEHIEKRKRFGKHHPNWKGDRITQKSGRSRAERAFPTIGVCEQCGSVKAERHHRNGDTTDNRTQNIGILCRRCHMREDGRLEQFIELAKRNHQLAVAARVSMAKPTHCPRGHLYVKENKRGCGTCYICLNEYKRNKRRMDKENRSGVTS